MNSKQTVTVLMSTYNGDRFLEEQIDSILNQQGVNVKLCVRDDGSSDDTLRKLLNYADDIDLTKGSNIGVGNSFMQMVYCADLDSDYFAFSDQDDIWMSDKLKTAVDKIKKFDNPVLYASNQLLVNADGEKISIRFNGDPGSNWEHTLCRNYMCGCTMVWNKEFQKLICEEKRRPSEKLLKKRVHDVWFATVADIAATLLYDDTPHIRYRLHENNVFGLKERTIASLCKTWLRKLKEPVLRNGRSDLCKELCQKYADLIDNDILDKLEVIGMYRDKSQYKRKLLKSRQIIEYSKETLLEYSLKVLFGLL